MKNSISWPCTVGANIQGANGHFTPSPQQGSAKMVAYCDVCYWSLFVFKKLFPFWCDILQLLRIYNMYLRYSVHIVWIVLRSLCDCKNDPLVKKKYCVDFKQFGKTMTLVLCKPFQFKILKRFKYATKLYFPKQWVVA